MANNGSSIRCPECESTYLSVTTDPDGKKIMCCTICGYVDVFSRIDTDRLERLKKISCRPFVRCGDYGTAKCLICKRNKKLQKKVAKETKKKRSWFKPMVMEE